MKQDVTKKGGGMLMSVRGSVGKPKCPKFRYSKKGVPHILSVQE